MINLRRFRLEAKRWTSESASDSTCEIRVLIILEIVNIYFNHLEEIKERSMKEWKEWKPASE